MSTTHRKRAPAREAELRGLIERGGVSAPEIGKTLSMEDVHEDFVNKKRNQLDDHLALIELVENTELYEGRICAWHVFKTLGALRPARYRVLVDGESAAWLAVLYMPSVLRATLRATNEERVFTLETKQECERHARHWGEVARVALVIRSLLERGELLPETTAHVIRAAQGVRLRVEDARAVDGLEVVVMPRPSS